MADLKGERRGRKSHFSISIPSDTTRQLDAIAEQRGSTRGAIVREAVLYYLRHCHNVKAAS